MAASLHFVVDSTIDGRSLATVKEALQRFGHLVAIGQPHPWNFAANAVTPSISVHHNRWVPETSQFELVQVYPAAERPFQAFALREFNHALSAVNLAQSATSLAQRLQRSLTVSPPNSNSGGPDVVRLNAFSMEAGREPDSDGQLAGGGFGSQMAFLASLLRMRAQSNGGGSIVEDPENGDSLLQMAGGGASSPKLLSGASCKVIFVCGSILQDPADESFHSAVMEAATRCVSIDFLVVQPATGNKATCHSMRSGYTGDVCSPPMNHHPSRLEELDDAVSGYENCSLRCMPCDPVQLDSHTKRWLQHLHSCGADTTIDFALQFGASRATSKRAQGDGTAGAAKPTPPLSITCSAYPTVLQLHDTIQPCLTCRCHGVPLTFPSTLPGTSSPPLARSASPTLPLTKAPSRRCPVTGQRLDASDVASNTVMLGASGNGGRRSGGAWDGDLGADACGVLRESGGGEEEVWRRRSRGRARGERLGRDDVGDASGGGRGTLLHLPSFKTAMEAPRLHGGGTPAVPLTVIKRVPLSSVSEGLIFGLPHVLMPSQNLELDFSNSSELSEMERNEHAFAALCRSLNQHDKGLLCSGLVDADTRMDVSFPCFYLLLPTEAGTFLLRRVTSAEELLPLPPRPISNLGEEDEEKGEQVAAAVDMALSQLEEEAFNPVEVERGCHQRLQWLLKESLYFQPIPPGRQGSNLHSVSYASRSSSRSPSSSSPSTIAATTVSSSPGGSPALLAAATGRRERRRSGSSSFVPAGAAGAAGGAGAGVGAGGGAGGGRVALPVSAFVGLDGDSGKFGVRLGADLNPSAAEDWHFRARREQRMAQLHQINQGQQNQPQQMQHQQQQQQQMRKGLASGQQAYNLQTATAAAPPLRSPFVPTPPPRRTTQTSFQSPSSGAVSSSPSHRKLFPYLSAPPRAPSPSRPSPSRFIITASPPAAGIAAGRAGDGAVGHLENTSDTGEVNNPAAAAAAAAAAAVRAPAQSLSEKGGSQSTPPPVVSGDCTPAVGVTGTAPMHTTATAMAAAAAPRLALHVPAEDEDEIDEDGSAAWPVELERLSSGAGKGAPRGPLGLTRNAGAHISSSRGSRAQVAGDGGREEEATEQFSMSEACMQPEQTLPQLQLPPSTAQWPSNPHNTAAAAPSSMGSPSTMAPPSGYSRPSLPPALSAEGQIHLARRQQQAEAPPVPAPLQDNSNLHRQAQAALTGLRGALDKPHFSQAPRFASIPGMQRAGMGGGRYARVPGAAGTGGADLKGRGGEAGTGEGDGAGGKGSRKGGFRRIRQGKV
ncbi:hypothetical protein CLOM_g6176 [Closterium sp. NIES-68]|nr:hypothetical protein CLOM_g6176 [Closterium sp. NIES-68]GJP59904.1 hypothetical protein CLOP_g15749 [Closterium sp. NIES-67]